MRTGSIRQRFRYRTTVSTSPFYIATEPALGFVPRVLFMEDNARLAFDFSQWDSVLYGGTRMLSVNPLQPGLLRQLQAPLKRRSEGWDGRLSETQILPH